MIKKYIDIDDGKWGIILIYGFDADDEYEMSAIMDSFGMNEINIRKSLKVLSTYNSGMAVSRDDLQMSVVFIGKTTSRSQFWNSIGHELHHVANAIIDYYGEPYDGEPSAYLHGHILQLVVEEIAIPCA